MPYIEYAEAAVRFEMLPRVQWQWSERSAHLVGRLVCNALEHKVTALRVSPPAAATARVLVLLAMLVLFLMLVLFPSRIY
jgi:hypothetical protein